MLVRHERRSVVAVVLIDRPHLQRSVSQGGDAYLSRNDSGFWCKGALVERDIEVKGTERENIKYRLLPGC
jgi:phosphoribosyl-AMP cyclohydrolase